MESAKCQSVNERLLTCRIRLLDEGIPCLIGNSLEEVIEGLGFIHAYDRGIQMLLMRLFGKGQTAEFLAASDELVGWDIYARQLTPSADQHLDIGEFPPQVRYMLTAYCRGVNKGFSARAIPKPLQWFGLKWWPWTPADVMLVGRLIGYIGLAESQAYAERWVRDCIRAGISAQMLDELFPGKVEGLNAELVRIAKEPPAAHELSIHQLFPFGPQASNNWVVSGQHTASGFPILANDPHLQINRLPQIWYEVMLVWQGEGGYKFAAGASIPGIPGIIVGRNEEVAWGVTYAFVDSIDSWIEECKQKSYRRNSRWVPFRIRTELIRRKGKAPIKVDFYENDHGSMLLGPSSSGLYVITRWAVDARIVCSSIEGVLAVLEARSAQQAKTCLAKINNGAWNWVFADRYGNIGYQMSGVVPLRASPWSGLIPMPGWDPQWDWLGFASADQLPAIMNPPDGIFVTANNELDSYGSVPCTSFTMGPYRANRIRELLFSRRNLTVEDMRQIQLDLYSEQARLYLDRLRPLLGRFTASFPRHVQILQDWDLRYDLNSEAAVLFERFYYELVKLVFGHPSNLGPQRAQMLLEKTNLLGGLFHPIDRVLLRDHSLWFQNHSWQELYCQAFQQACHGPIQQLRQQRRVLLAHTMLERVPLLRRLFGQTVFLPGGRATVSQGQLLPHRSGVIAVAPSYRFVTDLGSNRIYSSLPGGRCDRPWCKGSIIRLRAWRKGILTPLQPPT